MNGASPIFVLLTDFGLADPYVGQLKAALFSHAPTVPILDLSHGVPPFAVPTGAFFLAASRRHYPKNAIFICVVDPGVGSNRDLLCITGTKHTLLGPDNGLLSLACRDMRGEGPVTIHALSPSSPDTDGAANSRLTPEKSSNTFHGRDILAPVAAALASGSAICAVGARPREEILMPSWAEPEHGSGEIACTVLHTDRFGNCILNLPNEDELPLYPRLFAHVPKSGKSVALRQVSHYAELPPGNLGILPGGQGFYELALAQAPAARELGLFPGDICRIRGALWRDA